MSHTKWRIRVPGNALIAGEYAILEPNQHAVVMAIDRFIIIDIELSNENRLSLPDLGLDYLNWSSSGKEVVFNLTDSRLAFIKQTISVVNQFLQEKNFPQDFFHLKIKSQLEDASGQKYGLGSSAALVVGVVSAILAFYKIHLSREEIFKLSVLSHLTVQKNGSGADIAASTYGGWVYYSAYHSDWLENELKKGGKITELLETPWPNLMITSLKPAPDLKWGIGWTGEAATRGPMVEKIRKIRDNKPELYQAFLQESYEAVAHLIQSFSKNDCGGAIKSIADNREALKKLDEVAKIPIETEKLTRLCEIANEYGSGKSSGTGGGDCGIAFVQGENKLRQLYKAWEQEGIHVLNMKVSHRGYFVRKQFYWEYKLNSDDGRKIIK
ncbi:phosphomevalonate kinase [Bacillus sp. B15-48]|uniref:phosphomevalonate kinase n=1 Tax=Bacillus sp. B15-48 TaxID=1548601 RepID=UPI0019400B88|nr:phosphomevalonate kinase [Bacillus sp. B15-48]MBM4763824.1 phosphomevalonate kinase [Bacillus sp. B15-48]